MARHQGIVNHQIEGLSRKDGLHQSEKRPRQRYCSYAAAFDQLLIRCPMSATTDSANSPSDPAFR